MTALAGDLQELLAEGAEMASPAMAADSFEPLDVRLGVRGRFGQELFRLAPGGWERPLSIVEDAKLLARALDSTLEQRLGFGLADLTELALRHMDESLDRLSACWPTADGRSVPVWERDAVVTDEEVSAAVSNLDIASAVSRCHDPDRAGRALRWASCAPDGLETAVDGQAATFGPVIAVRHGEQFRALPTGFLIDGLYAAMHALWAIAVEEPGGRERWSEVARGRVLALISGPGALLAVGADAGRGPIVALQQIHDGLVLAVDVVAAGIDGLALADAEDRLRAFVPGATVRTRRGEMTLDLDEEVVRLAVVAGPEELMIFRGEESVPVHVMLAEDLRWILGGADRRDDLAIFLLDCQTPVSERQFSFGPFDLWEVWRGNGGAFHRLGAPLAMLLFEPHHERAEWLHHARLGWLDEALVRLELPGLTAWPNVAPDRRGPAAATLTDRFRNEAVDVAVLDDGTVIGVRYRVDVNGHVRPANIAHAILWKLRQVGGVASVLASASVPGRVRIQLAGPVDLGGDTLRVVRSTDDDGYVLGFSEDFGEELLSDASSAERHIAVLLSAGLPDRLAHDFVTAWAAAPPGIAIDASSPPQRARMLGSFQPPHGTFQARAERATASRLLGLGVRPGTRQGTEARDLESRQIYPLLLELYREATARFDGPTLVRAILHDLERVHLGRWRDEGHQGRLAALATPDIDITTAVTEARGKVTAATRALTLAAEEALRGLPQGADVPRHLDLQQIYGIAYLLFESGMRSETIHQRVSGAKLEITESYEFVVRPADLDFDVDAFNRALTMANPPQRLIAPEPDEAPDETLATAVERVPPEITGVDSAMRASLGFGVYALLCVLDTVANWAVDDDEPVVSVPAAELVAQAAELTDGDLHELTAAVGWLTLRPAALQGEMLEHWELDRRAVRLASRPLVSVGAEGVFICPWAASMSRRIFLGHLSDGRLPWPQSALPDPVNKQLQAFRHSRNIALEREIITTLSQRTHLKALGNIKKAKVLGLTTLPREIDGICIDMVQGRIWVLEAKDRTVAFSPHQLRTAIDEFHEPGGYIDRLLANVDLIRASASTVATTMRVENPGRAWHVQGLMVTRRIEPAAYAGGNRVLFCTADTVAETVDTDVIPARPYQSLVPTYARPSDEATLGVDLVE
ncbi:hypothetical protein GCM10007977_061750 [Dactylosporangium sucinum]|uniref:Uncharacterized protein n=1 Tax=Dactylosporangium sucinum TaxID=1424081 RepID=A0A917X1T0_9ACTN|nr:hypothetical protein GCM10007977_061750 [Dactylosporangium sucinum]